MTKPEFRTDSISDIEWNYSDNAESYQTFILDDETIERLKNGEFVTFTIYGEYGINIAYKSEDDND